MHFLKQRFDPGNKRSRIVGLAREHLWTGRDHIAGQDRDLAADQPLEARAAFVLSDIYVRAT